MIIDQQFISNILFKIELLNSDLSFSYYFGTIDNIILHYQYANHEYSQ